MAEVKALHWPKVILFGDSITQVSFEEGGWGSYIADFLQRKCDVLNRGLSGYNTRWARILLPRILPDCLVRESVLATVFFGANDASLKEISPDKYISIEEYAANLKAIVEHLLTNGLKNDQIILIGPPAFNAEEWKKQCTTKGIEQNRSNKNTGGYSRACSQVAKDLNTKYIDLWTVMQEDPDWKRYLCDGLHLSPEGSQLLWQQLLPSFDKVSQSLDTLCPDWSTIDSEDPEPSLLGTSV